MIYHYTSWQGLLGILGSRQLWVSDTQYLNDPQELRYAVNAVQVALNQKLRGNNNPEAEEVIRRLILSLSDKYPPHGPVNAVMEDMPYVASFCQEGDLLSMWRSYADGGVSIGFDAKILSDSSNSWVVDGARSWCEMTEEETQHLRDNNFGLRGELSEVIYGAPPELAEALLKNAKAAKEAEVRSEVFVGVKHPSYAEEREIRLVIHITSCMVAPVFLRAGKTNLVPYRTVEFPFSAIRRLTVGPGPFQERNYSALTLWRDLGGGRAPWRHVKIERSAAPFVG